MCYIRWFQTKKSNQNKELNQTKEINEQTEREENKENKENKEITRLKKRALKQEPHIILAAFFAADVKMGLRVF